MENYSILTTIFLAVCLGYCQVAVQSATSWCSSGSSRGTQQYPMPKISNFYSTNIHVNNYGALTSVELRRVVDKTNNRDSLELWSKERHVRYITLGADDAFVNINHAATGNVCKYIKQSTKTSNAYEQEDGDLIRAILSIEEALNRPDGLQYVGRRYLNEVPIQTWSSCILVEGFQADAQVNASFSVPPWKPSFPLVSSIKETQSLFEIAQVTIQTQQPDRYIELNYYNYLPLPPSDTEFQVPENIYCDSFRPMENPLRLRSYFTYSVEKVQYSDDGKPSAVTHTVYYDNMAKLIRIDDNSWTEKSIQSSLDSKNEVISTVIYDFNLGIQYNMNKKMGVCDLQKIEKSFDALSSNEESTGDMLTPKRYFLLDGPASFNGVYETRGVATNLFTKTVKSGSENRLLSWYITMEDPNLGPLQRKEKSLLVKMTSRPEKATGKEGSVELNIYNFMEDEPNPAVFDISSCYNDSLSKLFMLTFPGIPAQGMLQNSISDVQRRITQAIQQTAGVSRQRIFIEQVRIHDDSTVVAEFKILSTPPMEGTKSSTKENSLEDAIKQLKASISKGSFKVTIPLPGNLWTYLRPANDGLVELDIRKVKKTEDVEYNEGSVLGIAIGMTILGFFLGGVVVNLIISRKYGVSLFQRIGFGTERLHNGPNGESVI